MVDKLERFPADEAMQLFVLSDDCIKSTGGAGDIDTSKAKAIIFFTQCSISVGSGSVQAPIAPGSCYGVAAKTITVDTDVAYALM